MEGDVGALIKSLEPTHQLFAFAKALFRYGWDQRLTQAKDAIRSSQRQIKVIEKQVEALLTRIMDATNTSVIGAYEVKIGELERGKIILAEQLAN